MGPWLDPWETDNIYMLYSLGFYGVSNTRRCESERMICSCLCMYKALVIEESHILLPSSALGFRFSTNSNDSTPYEALVRLLEPYYVAIKGCKTTLSDELGQ